MRKASLLVFVALIASVATLAWACGPYFPQAFLPERAKLKATPIEGDFRFELGRYSKAIREGTSSRQIPDRDTFEKQSSDSAHYELIYRMRAQPEGNAAYAQGTGLPEVIRQYTAGAVDFHRAKAIACEGITVPNNDFTVADMSCNRQNCDAFGCGSKELLLMKPNPAIRQAIQRFEKVLALPESERRSRAVWAAYGLGDIYLRFDLPNRQKMADAYYRQVEKLVGSGYPDPLDLASASLGQRAQIKLETNAVGAAVALYVKQGDMNSLTFLARQVLNNPSSLKAQIRDPNVRRLVLAYVFSHSRINVGKGKWPEWMETLVGLAIKAETPLEDTDRLAVISYQAGRYDLAEKLAERVESPLSYWVRARMARRSGDSERAATFHARSLEASSSRGGSIPRQVAGRLAIEKASSDLDHGRFSDALSILYRSGPEHWLDTAYVAERVVTIAELQRFVASIPTAQKPTKKTATNVSLGNSARSSGSDPNDVEPLDQEAQIRALLARRLMRAGYFTKAELHFEQANKGKLVPLAREYAKESHIIRTSSDPFVRAAAEFRLGILERKHGMDLLGYELAPDYYYVGGNYGAMIFLDTWDGRDDWVSSSLVYGKKGMSEQEAKRFADTQPRIDRRYHYRYRAMNNALDAASRVPKRSQAYRALLCQAAVWVPDPEVKQQIYRRYLKQGSYMKSQFPKLFGRKCEVPDFELAQQLAKISRRSQTSRNSHFAKSP